MKVVILESIRGTVTFFLRDLIESASGAEVETVLLAVRDEQERPIQMERLREAILTSCPDQILFLMDAPLVHPQLWDEPVLSAIPKTSLWFDDMLRSPLTLGGWEIWSRWQRLHHVQVFVWDAYWRREWEQKTGVSARPIQLAPDIRIKAQTPLYPAWSHHALFVGTIPSKESVDQQAVAFPSSIKMVLTDAVVRMEEMAWPVNAYLCWQQACASAPSKIQSAIEGWCREPAREAILNGLVWRWGKRVARLRGLRAVAAEVPVAIASGHRIESFAGEHELRATLGYPKGFAFQETTNLDPSRWGGLFCSGHMHLQFFDPQSMEGGLPFRIFECAACRVPLLSDSRPELASLFPPHSGLYLVANEEEAACLAPLLMQRDRQELIEEAAQAHQIQQAKHTWIERWKELLHASSSQLQSSLPPF